MSALERIWYDADFWARAARAALSPASWLYGAGVQMRGWRFDHATEQPSPLPALSLGNLTVGGTG